MRARRLKGVSKQLLPLAFAEKLQARVYMPWPSVGSQLAFSLLKGWGRKQHMRQPQEDKLSTPCRKGVVASLRTQKEN